MLLAEKLLLVSLDPTSGYPYLRSRLDTHLAAALLLELAEHGRVAVEPGGPLRRARVTLTDASPTDDDVLDGALRLLGTPRVGNRLTETLTLVARGLEPALLARLEVRGVVRHDVDRFLLVLRNDVWKTVDRRPRDAVADAVSAVLVDGREPDPHEAILTALVGSLGTVHRLLDLEGAGVRREDVAVRLGTVSAALDPTGTVVLRALVNRRPTDAPGIDLGSGSGVDLGGGD